VKKDGDRDIVFVVREQKAQRRAVSLGGTVGDAREVLAGVAAGDSVVVDPPEGLKDGARLEVAK
jgi:multidrug efflux pump subunit AcrA (membrane-fusion protein)